MAYQVKHNRVYQKDGTPHVYVVECVIVDSGAPTVAVSPTFDVETTITSADTDEVAKTTTILSAIVTAATPVRLARELYDYWIASGLIGDVQSL